jgi:hypothetical protein
MQSIVFSILWHFPTRWWQILWYDFIVNILKTANSFFIVLAKHKLNPLGKGLILTILNMDISRNNNWQYKQSVQKFSVFQFLNKYLGVSFE